METPEVNVTIPAPDTESLASHDSFSMPTSPQSVVSSVHLCRQSFCGSSDTCDQRYLCLRENGHMFENVYESIMHILCMVTLL